MREIKLFLLDMDGTVYVDGVLIEGAKEAVYAIRESGRQVCFLTNNSSRTAFDYVKKLRALGIEVRPDEVYTSGDCTARYIKKNLSGARVFLLGNAALEEDFGKNGISTVENNPDVVVLAYDTDLTYEKLARASDFINNGAYYLATHSDLVCPARPFYLPDAGSFIALIEISTGRLPQVICGKPFAPMAEAIDEKFSLKPNEIAMAGDRLYTDLLFAKNNSYTSILVFSGETTREMYDKNNEKADYTFDTIRDIIDYL
jgi:HAD superfamily hydrolase (TIGR01450 family)